MEIVLDMTYNVNGHFVHYLYVYLTQDEGFDLLVA